MKVFSKVAATTLHSHQCYKCVLVSTCYHQCFVYFRHSSRHVVITPTHCGFAFPL